MKILNSVSLVFLLLATQSVSAHASVVLDLRNGPASAFSDFLDESNQTSLYSARARVTPDGKIRLSLRDIRLFSLVRLPDQTKRPFTQMGQTGFIDLTLDKLPGGETILLMEANSRDRRFEVGEPIYIRYLVDQATLPEATNVR